MPLRTSAPNRVASIILHAYSYSRPRLQLLTPGRTPSSFFSAIHPRRYICFLLLPTTSHQTNDIQRTHVARHAKFPFARTGHVLAIFLQGDLPTSENFRRFWQPPATGAGIAPPHALEPSFKRRLMSDEQAVVECVDLCQRALTSCPAPADMLISPQPLYAHLPASAHVHVLLDALFSQCMNSTHPEWGGMQLLPIGNAVF